jgi:phage shock protein A
MAKHYNFDGVMSACSAGSYLSNSLDSLQDNVEELQKCIKELEKLYHGIGTKSSIYKVYEEMYSSIGGASNYNYWNNSGIWSAIQNIVYKADVLYDNAERDKAEWEEEQRRLEEERQRLEEERRANGYYY